MRSTDKAPHGYRYDLQGGAATIVLDDGRGNAMTLESLAGLLVLVRRAVADDARVVVLTAAPGSAFCVGGDVVAFATAPDPARYVDDVAEALHRVVSELTRMDAIVVSVVHRTAAGAGVPLAAAADVVLAGASAKFTLGYTKIGLTPDGGSTLLPASLGLHRTLALALLNPVLSAAQAQEAGLVARVFADDELDAEAGRLIGQLLAGSRSAQVGAKRLIRAQATPAPEQTMRLETLSIRQAAGSPDGREGVRAFRDKRAPQFPSHG